VSPGKCSETAPVLTWLLAIGFVLPLGVLAHLWLRRPRYYQLRNIGDARRYFADFLDYFAEGSLLFIEHRLSGCLVQFRRDESDQGPVLFFGFPDAAWSHTYLAGARRALAGGGWRVETQQTMDAKIPIFLHAGGIQNADDAVWLAGAVFQAVDVPGGAKLRLHYRGFHRADVVNSMKARIAARGSRSANAASDEAARS
jgi:hypothetical protein